MSHRRGLHHVTCVCNDWERTDRFYEGLGFRLVKNTVNHDAPDTRHTYHADAAGSPGTVITFFEWPSDRRAQPGLQTAAHVALSLPADLSLDAVVEHASALDRPTDLVEDAQGRCLQTQDPDGLSLRVYQGDGDGPRLHHVGLYGAVEERERFFGDRLGFTMETKGDGPPIVRAADGSPVLALLPGNPSAGRIAPGAVHHVAFAVEDEDEQTDIRERLQGAGTRATTPIDRFYFRSVYSRDPAGHIIEFATLGPGFTVDEDVGALGSSLVLPPWLEDERERIEGQLEHR